MIEEICRELNNYFDENSDGTRNRLFGTFQVVDGAIDLSETGIQPGQYFRIVGSVFNDGVYKYEPEVEPTQEHPETHRPVLQDETFNGAVWLMAVPKAVIDLASEIEAWQAKYGGVDSQAMSPFTSESFGGYSYSKSSRTGSGSGSDNGNGSGTWQSVYANRLNKWRKFRAV